MLGHAAVDALRERGYANLSGNTEVVTGVDASSKTPRVVPPRDLLPAELVAVAVALDAARAAGDGRLILRLAGVLLGVTSLSQGISEMGAAEAGDLPALGMSLDLGLSSLVLPLPCVDGRDLDHKGKTNACTEEEVDAVAVAEMEPSTEKRMTRAQSSGM